MLDGLDPNIPGPTTYKTLEDDQPGQYIISKYPNSRRYSIGIRTDSLKNKRFAEQSNLGPAAYFL